MNVLTLVHGRHAHLLNVIRGLERSTVPPAALVIVQMNEAPLRWESPRFPIIHCAINSNNDQLPLAAARNAAVDHSPGDDLVFLDVDCVPRRTCWRVIATNSPSRRTFCTKAKCYTSLLPSRVAKRRPTFSCNTGFLMRCMQDAVTERRYRTRFFGRSTLRVSAKRSSMLAALKLSTRVMAQKIRILVFVRPKPACQSSLFRRGRFISTIRASNHR